jgi:3-oxoacyl-[acyl-carrier protein] reductase
MKKSRFTGKEGIMTINSENPFCVVFGGCRGLGAAIATRFLEAKWNVLVVGRSGTGLCCEENREQYQDGDHGTLSVLRADLDQKGFLSEIIDYLLQNKLRPRVMVHNYGGTVSKRLVSEGLEGWLECLWKNVFFSAEINSRVLKNSEISFYLNRIVHISSASARHLMGSQVYSTSKALLNAYVRTNGRLIAKRGVVQLAVAPGALDTDNGPWSRKGSDILDDFLRHYQFSGHLGSEQTISELVFNLCGPAGDFCHGNVIECDGGSL